MATTCCGDHLIDFSLDAPWVARAYRCDDFNNTDALESTHDREENENESEILIVIQVCFSAMDARDC